MGGRGNVSGFISRLPNYQRARILGDKVKNYLLNPNKSNGKSELFRSLGYTMKDAKRLSRDIQDGLKNNRAVQYEPNKHGNVMYNVTMRIGKDKTAIKTVWQIDKGSNIPRFITAYKARR